MDPGKIKFSNLKKIKHTSNIWCLVCMEWKLLYIERYYIFMKMTNYGNGLLNITF